MCGGPEIAARSTAQRSMSTLGVCSTASSCGTSGSWVLWVGGLLGRPTGYSMDVRASSGASKELADDTVYAQVCGMRYAVCSG
jgi:hypothetical protein